MQVKRSPGVDARIRAPQSTVKCALNRLPSRSAIPASACLPITIPLTEAILTKPLSSSWCSTTIALAAPKLAVQSNILSFAIFTDVGQSTLVGFSPTASFSCFATKSFAFAMSSVFDPHEAWNEQPASTHTANDER